MGRKKQPLTLSLLIKEGNGALTPENDEMSLNQETEPTMAQPTKSVATKRGRPKKREAERFKKTLNRLLSMLIAPETVTEAVKSTPLGDKITYQEAILIAQILKASNGDTQSAAFLRDTSGNKLKEGAEEESRIKTFEEF